MKRLWTQTEGKSTDALGIFLQRITGTDDDRILKWLERSKAVYAIAHNREDSEYRLRWLHHFIKELREVYLYEFSSHLPFFNWFSR